MIFEIEGVNIEISSKEIQDLHKCGISEQTIIEYYTEVIRKEKIEFRKHKINKLIKNV